MKSHLTAALLVCLPGIIAAPGCQCRQLACAPPNDRPPCSSCHAAAGWGLFRARTPVVAVPAPVVASPMPQPPAAIGSPAPQPTLQAPVPSTPTPADYRSYEAPADQTWHAAPGSQPTTSSPGSTPPEPPPAALRLLPPEPTPPASTESPPPAVSEERSRPSSLPVGIPQFAAVRDQVAAGLKPSLDGGLDWLQANGYRTVLHIRSPGEDDTADRREVEKRGLKYLSLEVSPETLSRTLVEQFSRIINDRANYPLFVYDKDGMKAGSLWYLMLRLVDHESDEAARTRASRLGLNQNPEGNHRAMWLAIQKTLNAAG